MARLLILAFFLLVGGCAREPEYGDDWMDSPLTQDPALSDSSSLVSTRPGLTAVDRQRPVIIAAHGFSASTYEWGEFRTYAEANSDVLVSLVLLGGHGRDLDTFEASTWEEWGAPILAEYHALAAQGFTNLSLAGASTGGTLLLEQLSRNAYDRVNPPDELFFIDALVVSTSKMLRYARQVGPLIGNVPWEPSETERRHWYTNRPWRTLAELNDLLMKVRRSLRQGISLPEGTRATVWKTTGDEVVDPVSADWIKDGLRGPVEVQMIESDIHVITRLRARTDGVVTESDRRWQHRIFDEMIQKVQDGPPRIKRETPVQ